MSQEALKGRVLAPSRTVSQQASHRGEASPPTQPANRSAEGEKPLLITVRPGKWGLARSLAEIQRLVFPKIESVSRKIGNLTGRKTLSSTDLQIVNIRIHPGRKEFFCQRFQSGGFFGGFLRLLEDRLLVL